ncbi:UDP-N-acetylgalactosamine-undecaprenyl-phosphate N-acetylgalactosaminephosphotransferase [Clostridiales bacterium CHKCI006]|nr:UDP-N-acetylgalactosamine-undecaprenyl-phosphate N-acetylgalactosaminephosphotransferase [Clostridiales bacterium CHKCI006]
MLSSYERKKTVIKESYEYNSVVSSSANNGYTEEIKTSYCVDEENTKYTNAEYEAYFAAELSKYKNTIKYEPRFFYELFKRILDIVLCLILAIPAALIILVFSIIIVLDSKGGPIFSQVRVGKNGKLMKIHKLRSMREDAEKNGQKWAEEDDPRVTRIGKIIRKYRIDELPQIYDVLIGKMSLIGPRPEIPALTMQFNKENPGFVTRLLVTPGLSGLAQVYGGYDATPKEKLEKDNQYVESRCIYLYIKIVLLTIKTIFTGNGAR